MTLRFGGVVALDEVSFHINKGEILGLIGPNGAGKTTCFNVMTGVYQPTSGAVRFLGEPLGRRKKFEITKLGIARTFQNIRLFANMTALENVLVGADAHHSTGVGSAMFRLPKHRARGGARAASARQELLTFMGLGRKADELARNLPYGDQRASRSPAPWRPSPKLLCLDEPAAGFNPAEKAQADGADPHDPRPGLHRAAHRARHEARHGRDRPDRRAGVRPQDRRGPARRDPDNPAVIAAYLGVDEEDAS